MSGIHRRDFLKIGLTGLTAIAVGSDLKLSNFFSEAHAQAVSTIDLTITEALVEMVDLTPVYHWLFSTPQTGPSFPGPVIQATEGEVLTLNIRNNLDEPHAFAISGTRIRSGPIAANGGTKTITFPVPPPGTYLYYDPMNAPVNRVLGLHGTMIVLPAAGNNPYSNPTPALAQLFNDLGTTAHFPGVPWALNRNFIWHMHSVMPNMNLLAQPAGAPPIDPGFMVSNWLARYFMISGKTGHFCADDKTISPNGFIGQPCMIRVTNSCLNTFSPHIHANHIYICSVNGAPQHNIWHLDTYTMRPMDRVDWMCPLVRPKDTPVKPGNPGITAASGHVVPSFGFDGSEEFNFITPDWNIRLSPPEYPMHCHNEPSQTAAGGNYNAGLLAHLIFLGEADQVTLLPEQVA